MSRRRLIAALAALPLAAAAARAQTASATAAAEQEMAEGEVRRIDRAQGKVTLRHGRIEHLDMPPMTMVFRLQDPAWADALKVGDRVRFSAAKAADGGFVVTAISPAS